jgi:hypothetical protein
MDSFFGGGSATTPGVLLAALVGWGGRAVVRVFFCLIWGIMELGVGGDEADGPFLGSKISSSCDVGGHVRIRIHIYTRTVADKHYSVVRASDGLYLGLTNSEMPTVPS